jgi:hypothetical protein
MPAPLNIAELMSQIFPNGGALSESCAEWAIQTPRFRTFLEQNSGKVRKKARGLLQDGQEADLRAELAVATMLLGDRRVELTYEPLAATGQRGPDFAARFRVNTLVYVEVAHLRPVSSAAATERLAGVLVSKLRQFQPGAANMLMVVLSEPLEVQAIALMVERLRQRAARGESFPHMRDVDPPTLLRLRPRVSAIAAGAPGAPITLWAHPQARHMLPAGWQTMLASGSVPG